MIRGRPCCACNETAFFSLSFFEIYYKEKGKKIWPKSPFGLAYHFSYRLPPPRTLLFPRSSAYCSAALPTMRRFRAEFRAQQVFNRPPFMDAGKTI